MGAVVPCTPDDLHKLSPLLAKFRAALKAYKGIIAVENTEAAHEEAQEFFAAGFPIFAYEEKGAFVGYIVCRQDGAWWVEQLYVLPTHRGRGAAEALYAAAEKLAAPDTLYNWVHPNNDGMIRFLAKRGYDTLNLIEIRKKYEGEEPRERIAVGNNVFNY